HVVVDVLVVELERERRRRGEDRQRVDLDLDLARGQIRIDELGRARDDLPLGLDHELVAQVVGLLRRLSSALRIHDELDDPGLIAEVDEDEAAVIAARVDPAGDRDTAADVVLAELARVRVAPGHATSSSSSVRAVRSCSPRRRRTKPSLVTTTIDSAP